MGRPKKIIIESGGLGTKIADTLEATGVKKLVDIFLNGKDCGCDERKEKLNKILPSRFKARCFTEVEYNAWKEFTAIKTITITAQQVKFICELHHNVFLQKGNVYYPCSGCSPKPLIQMIDKLDKVYETYN